MIIFNGEKYSCVSCIRGHRSSSCKHSERMLVKVRTRGRPSPLDIRKVILVDRASRVEELDGSGQDSGAGDESQLCCGMNKQPVLFLRAIATKKALLINGDLKIMVTSESGTPDSEVARKVSDDNKFVTEHEFLLNHVSPPPCKSCNSTVKRENETHSLGPTNTAENYAKRVKFEGQDMANLSNHELLSAGDNGQLNSVGNSTFQDSVVELFTQKGAYLSTTCSCNENCQCNNCLIHREEAELERYLTELNQPMINLGSAQILTAESSQVEPSKDFFHGETDDQNMGTLCLCEPDFCTCFNCEAHPDEVVTLSELLLYGVLNYKWKKKMVIKYRNKVIHSKYWWHYLTVEIPSMNEKQLRSLDLMEWFDNLISNHSAELPEANDLVHFTDSRGNAHHGNQNDNAKNDINVNQSIQDDMKRLMPNFGNNNVTLKKDTHSPKGDNRTLLTGTTTADTHMNIHDPLKFNNLIL
ncbi:Mac1 [Kluyveromyces lactis]|nr:Mac1 [Kluyveromyces lactis]